MPTYRKIDYSPEHPVAVAVEPLRADAVARAEKFARDYVARLEKLLQAHGMDREKAAPYPNGSAMARDEYMQLRVRYENVRKVTRSTLEFSRRHGAPDPCEMDPFGIDKFVKDVKEDAEYEYTAFICKLVGKIGACVSAELTGSHVWGFSLLHIRYGVGAPVETWKTQQIVNISKLGKVFNQWPSRKVK